MWKSTIYLHIKLIKVWGSVVVLTYLVYNTGFIYLFFVQFFYFSIKLWYYNNIINIEFNKKQDHIITLFTIEILYYWIIKYIILCYFIIYA